MGAWSILTVWALVNRTKIGFLQYRLSRAGSTYGKKAKQATSELPFRQEVTVITTGKDRQLVLAQHEQHRIRWLLCS